MMWRRIFCRRNFSRLAACLAFVLLKTVALAHDPYEITSTAYVRTNRMDVEIEMEFRAALALAGAEGSSAFEGAPEELFKSRFAALTVAAGNFFRVTAGGNLLAARATNVVLGVENHVRFTLEFPADGRRPLRFAAEGLKPLDGQGPYGTTLTVLDMVGKKVLGQSVLFPSSPVAEIAAQIPAAAVEIVEPPARAVQEHFTTAAPPAAPPPAPQTERRNRAPGAVLALVGLVLLVMLVLWRRRKSPGAGSQKRG